LRHAFLVITLVKQIGFREVQLSALKKNTVPSSPLLTSMLLSADKERLKTAPCRNLQALVLLGKEDRTQALSAQSVANPLSAVSNILLFCLPC